MAEGIGSSSMASRKIVEGVRGLIASHRERDEVEFQKNAEAIIREFAVENSPGEARYLREALGHTNGGKSFRPKLMSSVVSFQKQPQSLVSVLSQPRIGELFFTSSTRSALERIALEYKAAAQLAEAGLRFKSRLLFWGPPGCGKTASAHWLAGNLSLPLGIVRLGTLITSYVGETGANIQKVLGMAEDSSMVLLLDEADAIAKARDDANDVGELRRVVNALLQGLDNFVTSRSLIILASNHSHLFDPAVWRRFDDIVEFPLPGERELLLQLKHLVSGLRVRGSLVQLSRKLSGYSFAEVERAVLSVAKSKVLSDAKLVTVTEIAVEASRWRRKMKAALGTQKRRR